MELTPSMIRSTMVKTGQCIIELFLERLDSTSPQNNVGSATKVLQDSKKSNAAKRVKCESKNTNDVIMEEEYDVMAMSVPDADFYNFDKDRVEASFGENQVWAAYDDYGMPRWYALVHKVVSQEPFKTCISWLDGKKNGYVGSMKKWIDSGYYKTSGCFSIEKRSSNDSLNSFSHRVQWTICEKGLVHIYPRKGNVWALYENWSPSWDISTSVEEMNKYEMVEVLQDFSEEGGVTVVPLVQVPGFITVFRRLPKQRTFPRNELFRFSHQVPSHFLTSQDGENDPEGCLELDPAALPQELLKIVTKEEMKESENVVIKKPEEEANEVVQAMNNVGIDDEAKKKLETVVKKPEEEVDDVLEIPNNVATDDETKVKIEWKVTK
ncbi:unnamed protein product [Arabidopsis arenosa]|uniref:DUF3444 domain-containing protein n=1 Tax=Arabidopsis arenosa TaxID=38785 RepID=A0A8S2B1Y7_ARAAE|nr:unnamed protein product [Arabidopsis arenosa]